MQHRPSDEQSLSSAPSGSDGSRSASSRTWSCCCCPAINRCKKLSPTVRPITYESDKSGSGVNFSDESLVHRIEAADSDSLQVLKTYSSFRMSGSKETYFATAWRPEGADTQAKGLMFVSHGFGEYVGVSYERVAERLAAKGFVVFGHDHVGHGRSTGERVQVATNFKEDYVKPVLAHCKFVANKYEERGTFLPFFCLANSMGATIALLAALADPHLFSGLVLIAPLIQAGAKIANPVKIAVARVMKMVAPSFEFEGLQDKSLITRDADEEERINKDMLGWKGGIKVRQGYLGYEALMELNAHLDLITAPILIMHGTADRVTRPEGSERLFHVVSSSDKELLRVPDAYHGLLVELKDVREGVIDTVVAWVLHRAAVHTTEKPTAIVPPTSEPPTVGT